MVYTFKWNATLNDLQRSQMTLTINSFFSLRSSPKIFLLLGKHSNCACFWAFALSVVSLAQIISFLICFSFVSLLKYHLIREAFLDHPYKLGNNSCLLKPRFSCLLFPTLFSLQHLSVPNILYCILVYCCLLTLNIRNIRAGTSASFTEGCPVPSMW